MSGRSALSSSYGPQRRAAAAPKRIGQAAGHPRIACCAASAPAPTWHRSYCTDQVVVSLGGDDVGEKRTDAKLSRHGSCSNSFSFFLGCFESTPHSCFAAFAPPAMQLQGSLTRRASGALEDGPADSSSKQKRSSLGSLGQGGRRERGAAAAPAPQGPSSDAKGAPAAAAASIVPPLFLPPPLQCPPACRTWTHRAHKRSAASVPGGDWTRAAAAAARCWACRC